MSVRDHEQPSKGGLDESQARSRQQQHRKLAATGVTGLAVVLGIAAYLIVGRDGGTMTQDTGAVAPVVASSSAAPPSAAPPSVPPSGSSTPGRTTAPAAMRSVAARPGPADAESVRKEINAARAKAAKDGIPLQRPLAPPPPRAVRNAESLTEESRETPDGGTMRIISAKYDLSDQREMLWAADAGKPVGPARCTQNFRFAQNSKGAERPTMLLCWRNAEERSVVVLSVVPTGTPSTTQTVNVLVHQWDKLG